MHFHPTILGESFYSFELMPEEKSGPSIWTLEAVGKVMEGLGFKELILQGFKSIGSRAKARKAGFEFHHALQSLEASLDGYLESLNVYLQKAPFYLDRWPEELVPRTRLRQVLWDYGIVMDLVEEIPQLKVYFPESTYLESGRKGRLLQSRIIKGDELDISMLEQLKVRLPSIKRNIKQIKRLAEQVREALKNEWGFADAF